MSSPTTSSSHVTQSLSRTLKDYATLIRKHRAKAYIGDVSQAERMEKRSHADLKTGELGDNVAVHIPAVDRDRGEPRKLIPLVSSSIGTDQYKIAEKPVFLIGQYSKTNLTSAPKCC